MAQSEKKQKPVKKDTTEKVSELDFKIKVLEGRESCLSESEVTRLNNLREMHEMQKKMGLSVNKSISINVLKKFIPPAKRKRSGEEVDSIEIVNKKPKDSKELNKSEDIKIKKVHSYNYFVREMKKKQKIDKTGGALNMEDITEAWKSLLPSEKLKYKTLAVDELAGGSGNTREGKNEEAKEMKRERDRIYRKEMAVRKKEEEIEKKNFFIDFEEILKEKKNKVERMREEKEKLNKEISSTVTENEIIQKMTAEKVIEELAQKAKLKLLFNHHKDCKNK